MTIALIGMPGAGKSSVGRQLAKRLNFEFLDSDSVIESRIQESIKTFFEREGESRFRDVEQAVIAELCVPAELASVIATGGGAVLRESNRQALQRHTVAIYLHASPQELYRRLHRDTKRPLLQSADPRAVVSRLYQERDPLYRQTACFTVETGRPTVKLLVDKVIAQLELAGHLAS